MPRQTLQTVFNVLTLGALLVGLGWVQTAPRAGSEGQPESDFVLPPGQIHPLPQPLKLWQAPDDSDYFEKLKPSRAGYLIWSQFPVKVYAAPVDEQELLTTADWQAAIAQAVDEWAAYFPLTLVDEDSAADIAFLPQAPQRRSGERVRSADTSYRFFLSDRQTLAHRFDIQIRPNQTLAYIKAAARHELGHALGLWGHSDHQDDVMYFSQVRQPPAISARDVNTLKRLYQQPTQLGWPVQFVTQAPSDRP